MKSTEHNTDWEEVKKSKNSKVSKVIWLILGALMCILSIIGLILPVLPQIPFLIATLLCFTKGSERFHTWIIQNTLYKRFLEKHLKKYMQDKKADSRDIHLSVMKGEEERNAI